MEEDPRLLRVLDPLHRVHESDWPLVRDGGGVHGLTARANREPRLGAEIWQVGAWVTSLVN